MWHYYAGLSLTLHAIDPRGQLRTQSLGPDPERGEAFQVVIPARCWFGATVNDPGWQEARGSHAGFTLMGCTVAPGFCFADFELGDRTTLVSQYPQHRTLIERLTPPR